VSSGEELYTLDDLHVSSVNRWLLYMSLIPYSPFCFSLVVQVTTDP
jgi:hypothetical protein